MSKRTGRIDAGGAVQDAGASFMPAPADAPEGQPHYHDHRKRLRRRFEQAGPEGFADYELLELLLFRSVPRRDVKPLAKALIAAFGDFAAVLAADPRRIADVDGAGPAVAQDLAIVKAALDRAGQTVAKRRTALSSWTQLIDYLKLKMAGLTREQFRVLFLDRKNHIIADEVMAQGTVDHAPVYPREVVRRALEHGASALILVHNHPSGDPTPSAADLAVTREIIAAGKTLEIAVHDHVVVGRHGVASFKSLGLI